MMSIQSDDATVLCCTQDNKIKVGSPDLLCQLLRFGRKSHYWTLEWYLGRLPGRTSRKTLVSCQVPVYVSCQVPVCVSRTGY
jgi:hypothetical protein